MDTTDYKQIAFKLQDDINFLKWKNADENISALVAIKSLILSKEYDKAVGLIDKIIASEKQIQDKLEDEKSS